MRDKEWICVRILTKYSFTAIHFFDFFTVVKLSVWFNCAMLIMTMLLDNAADNTILCSLFSPLISTRILSFKFCQRNHSGNFCVYDDLHRYIFTADFRNELEFIFICSV